MLEKLRRVEEHFGEVEARLGDPSIIADVEKFTALTREHATLEPIVKKIRAYKKIAALERRIAELTIKDVYRNA